MKQFALAIVVAALMGLALLWIENNRVRPVPAVACTEEAKLCPDGSSVGRSGPDCAFAVCPDISTTTPAGIVPYKSGVHGSMTLGPTCPVEKSPPDPACADKPLATAVMVYRMGAKVPYVIGNSDTDGIFQFSLPPGSYTLIASDGKTLPRCAPTAVTVTAEEFTTTTISCDSGIR